MNPKTAYATPGDDETRRGRLAKAREFLEAAETLREFGAVTGVFTAGSTFANAYVALCVLSGIAASDAICIQKLGQYHRGSDHTAAVPILSSAVGSGTAKHLTILLAVKSKAEYNARAVDANDISRAATAAAALVESARNG